MYQPGVPLYESYAQSLLALNGLPTLQQRVGNRHWGQGAARAADAPGASPALQGAGFIEGRGIWTRVEGSYSSVDPARSTSDTTYDQKVFRLQSGLDGEVYGTDAGKLVAGMTFQYARGWTDVVSPHGEGSISTDGYGVGGTLTWYGADGFYVDGQGQATWYDSDLSSSTAKRTLASGNGGFGYALSVEGGQRVRLDQGLTLTPQAQLMYSNVDFDSFTDPFGARVSRRAGDSLTGRIGVSLDQENVWAGNDGGVDRSHVYGIANLYYEMLGDGARTDVAGVRFSQRNDRLRGEAGVGGSYSWSNGLFSVYGEGSVSSSLTSFADSYALKGTAGLRIRW